MESFTPDDYIALMRKQIAGEELTDSEKSVLKVGAEKIEEQKQRDKPFRITEAMLRDAEKADFQHRKRLGNDY